MPRMHGCMRRRLILLCLGLCLAALIGCGDGETSRADARDTSNSATAPRIVTLAPALTQMLIELDMADRIVGVAEHDMAAPDGPPVVGNFTDIDTERLLSAQPTHVLTMSTKAQPPARLRELAEAGQFELVTYAYPNTIDQVLRILHRDTTAPAAEVESGPRPVGAVIDKAQAARQLKQDVRDQLNALREMTAPLDTPRVLVVIGLDPFMANGPDTVHHELLRYAGARNAIADADIRAPTYNRESLVTIKPDVIVIVLPGAPPLRDDDARLAALRGLPIPAVQNERIHLLNGPLIALPSTNVARIGAAMARAIHPQLKKPLTQRFDLPSARADAADTEPAP